MTKVNRPFGAILLILGVFLLAIFLIEYLFASAGGFLLTSQDVVTFTLFGIVGFGALVLGLYEILKK
jgi:thiol:disulfide interchange protein